MKRELDEEIAELQRVHEGLSHVRPEVNGVALSGRLAFDASTPDGPRIANSFEVRLSIPDVYPEMLPTVRETEGAIERSWGHVNQDGTLCLEVPI